MAASEGRRRLQIGLTVRYTITVPADGDLSSVEMIQVLGSTPTALLQLAVVDALKLHPDVPQSVKSSADLIFVDSVSIEPRTLQEMTGTTAAGGVTGTTTVTLPLAGTTSGAEANGMLTFAQFVVFGVLVAGLAL